jgi:hypothetical protein
MSEVAGLPPTDGGLLGVEQRQRQLRLRRQTLARPTTAPALVGPVLLFPSLSSPLCWRL